MKQNQAVVLEWIGLSEGGYVNHPKDPGGATDRGITQRTYDAWNRLHGRPLRPVRGISKDEANAILVSQYFAPVKFDQLPSGIDYAVVDFAVNSGTSRAAKELQKLLGVAVDGVIGNLTLAAISGRDIPELIREYCAARMRYLRGLKTWSTFGEGWGIRVEGKTPGFQVLDIGVIDRATMLARMSVANVADIPPPVEIEAVQEAGKGTDSDIAESTWWQKALQDPATWVPAVGGVATPMLSGTGPIQWAFAAVIVLGAVYAVARALRRSV